MLSETLDLWKGNELISLRMTPAMNDLLKQNFLVQLLYLDPTAFYLVRAMLNNFSCFLPELKEQLSVYLEPEDDIPLQVNKGLDTLLDSAMFKAEWALQYDQVYRRSFTNRGELVGKLKDFGEKYPGGFSNRSFMDKTMNLYGILFDEPVDLKERLKNTEISLSDFLNRSSRDARNDGCNVLVPLMRKGDVIVKRLLEEKKFDSHGLDISDLISFLRGKLKGKKPLFFDDASNRGFTIMNILDHLKNLNMKDYDLNMKDYDIATYCINTQYIHDDIRKQINFIGKSCNEKQFYSEVRDILLYIASCGSIIDFDHMTFQCEFENGISAPVIMELLTELHLGTIFEPDLDYLHPKRKKVTIFDINTRKVMQEENKDYPICIQEIDTSKIRMIFEKRSSWNDIYKMDIDPIVNPVIKVNSEKCNIKDDRQICSLIKEEYSDIETYPVEPHPCVDCVVYTMVTSLAKNFLRNFSQELFSRGIKFKVKDIQYPYMKIKYDNFYEKIFTYFQEELMSYVR